MDWSDRVLLITAVSVAIVNLATAILTLLRACQTWNAVKKRKD